MGIPTKKLTEAPDLDSDQQKLYKDMVMNEIRKKITKKIDEKDPSIMKAMKTLMDADKKI